MQHRSGRNKKSGGVAAKAVLLVGLVILGLGVLALVRVGAPIEIGLEPEKPAVGRKTPVTVHLSADGRGLSAVRVELIQGEKHFVAAESVETPRPFWAFWGPRIEHKALELVLGKETMPELSGGEATLRVTADRAATWFRSPAPTVLEVTLPVRLTPPTLTVSSSQNNVMQGGSEVVVYRVGPTARRDGVAAGDWWFPGAPLPGGGEGERFALYAAPYDIDDAKQIRLVAEDEVGNRAERAFIDRFTARPPTEANIQISDNFLAKVVPEILSESPEVKDQGDPLQSYLVINRELRKINNGKLLEMASKSEPAFLWRQPFRQLGNTQVMASFADHRSYVYGGKIVDHQYHLGFDLASYKHAPVTAANAGKVMLAAYFGIYGNTVVLDHGYGVMTLYSHLSSIDVVVGQAVAEGEKLGLSGETGLAAGDHLHFSVLVHGLPVTPVEWWDGKWIRDHLKAKLGEVLLFAG